MASSTDVSQNDVEPFSNAAAERAATAPALHPAIEQYAQLFKTGVRTPVLRRPSDIGLEYEDVFFPSLDGVPLEAWFIPAADSDKLLIVNHPMT